MVYDDNKQKAMYVGRKFNVKAMVKIEVSEGPLDGYIILAHPKSLTNNILSIETFPQSQFELDENKENYFGWLTYYEYSKFNRTDERGETIFEFLTITDMTGDKADLKFYFVAGDRFPDLYIKTNLTNETYTFIPSKKYEIVSQPSKFISANTFFSNNLKIRLTSYVPYYKYYVNILLTELFNSQFHDTPFGEYTMYYLDNSDCYIYNFSDWENSTN